MFFLFIISYDLWFYITHILMHTPKIYNWIHYKHHSVPYGKLEYTDTHIAHYAENIIQPLGILFPFLLFGFSASRLVNCLCAFLFISIRGLMRHDHRCTFLIGNHHLVHHKYLNCNYGEYWIDWIFGTHFSQKPHPGVKEL